ncbi:unnamed protein product, partial [Rangifer tarandus platyrhynchus]
PGLPTFAGEADGALGSARSIDCSLRLLRSCQAEEAATGLRARMQRAHGGSVGASAIDPVALAVRANCGRNTIFPLLFAGPKKRLSMEDLGKDRHVFSKHSQCNCQAVMVDDSKIQQLAARPTASLGGRPRRVHGSRSVLWRMRRQLP